MKMISDTLVRGENGWGIVNLFYTMEAEGGRVNFIPTLKGGLNFVHKQTIWAQGLIYFYTPKVGCLLWIMVVFDFFSSSQPNFLYPSPTSIKQQLPNLLWMSEKFWQVTIYCSLHSMNDSTTMHKLSLHHFSFAKKMFNEG